MTVTASHQWVLPTVVEFPPLQEIDLPLPIRAMLRRRGFDHSTVLELLEPKELPDPCNDFPDLERAVARVCLACERQEALAVCGDYDADGMTSTALLIRALKPLGADPIDAPGPANRGALRDDWSMESGTGETLRRWALPAALPVH